MRFRSALHNKKHQKTTRPPLFPPPEHQNLKEEPRPLKVFATLTALLGVEKVLRRSFKKWIKKEIGLMEGTTENWSTTKMEVQSLAELMARSGIETDLF